MANQQQVKLLKKGVKFWNEWRKEYPKTKINLSGISLLAPMLAKANLSNADLTKSSLLGANLSGADLNGADLSLADLEGANLNKAKLNGSNLDGAYIMNAKLIKAELNGANLSRAFFTYSKLNNAVLNEAVFVGTDLSYVDLSHAHLRKAELKSAFCFQTNFQHADMEGADLQNLVINESNLEQAVLTNCKVYGLSAWGLKGVPKDQKNLVITPDEKDQITVDDLQVAQFIYLLLNNQNIRNVIDTITSKAVLILGRFTPERKAVLDALYKELRNKNYLPILFDFKGSDNRDITETVSTLAHLARFVIADITDAKSVLQELRGMVPELPSLPVKPILLSTQQEPGMFGFFKRYPWFLETFYYNDINEVISSVEDEIIKPLEEKFLEVKPK